MTDRATPSLQEVLSRGGSRPLFILPDGERISYHRFLLSAEILAGRLSGLGLGAGDRILVTLENGEPLLRLYTACALLGVAVCPVDPASPPARLALFAQNIGPKLKVDAGVLDSLLDPAAPSGRLPAADEAERDFLILYSSGTTGQPKGIVHSVRSLIESAQSFAALSGLGEDSVIYHHFPMFYMAGIFNLFLCPAVAGATIVVGPQFSRLSMLRFWDLPQQFGVNHLTLTPTMAHALTGLYRTDDALLAHLGRYEAVISTGSILYGSVAQRFLDTFGAPLRSCYGVTEVGGSITLQDWDMAVGLEPCVGTWAPGTEIRAGTAADAPGELLIRTPTMMRGYISQGVVTPFHDAEGFFPTGDRGYIEDGRLFIAGRTNDAIKKGGEFVSLATIENHVLACPHIADAAAVGVPDDAWGNKIVLFYVPKAGADEDVITTALTEIFATQMRRIEHPDRIVPTPWFPKTSIGKTVKHQLVERYTL
jgi:acyl-CoA synthetase (AMP-forming)/AMP-acid ligase II